MEFPHSFIITEQFCIFEIGFDIWKIVFIPAPRENGMEWNDSEHWECTTCHALKYVLVVLCIHYVYSIRFGVWRSISMVLFNPFHTAVPCSPYRSILRTFMHSMLCAYCMYIGNVEKRPLECIRIDEQELKFLCLFHFNFKHSSFTLNRMPSTTRSFCILYARDATKPWIRIHFAKVYILYFIVLVLVLRAFSISKIIFFVLFYSLILHPLSLSFPLPLYLSLFTQILIPFRITFVISLLPFTETMTWLHNMQSAQHAAWTWWVSVHKRKM